MAVDNVSRDDARAFCRELSKLDGRHYRLPTEREWEYACRANSTQMFFGHDSLDEVALYKGSAFKATVPVGARLPNAWGLYDMLGGVWEWVDDFEEYPGVLPLRTAPSKNNEMGIVRGGSRRSEGRDCRCAKRWMLSPHAMAETYGFRIAVDLD
jgi:formylglycine-generating enzyme required for sulfatase activity